MKKVMNATVLAVIFATSSSAFAQPQEVAPIENMPGRIDALAPKVPVMEKCYGVTKAHMNDCASSANSCAGQSGFDADKNAWIYLPKGSCGKLINGLTTSSTQTETPLPNHDTSAPQ